MDQEHHKPSAGGGHPGSHEPTPVRNAQHRSYSRDDLILDAMTVLRETLASIYRDNVLSALAEEREADELDPPASPRERDPHSPLDARWAYEQMEREDRDLIDAFYRDQCRNKEMAESRGVSEQTMSDMHRRVLRRLAIMCGEPLSLPIPAVSSRAGRDGAASRTRGFACFSGSTATVDVTKGPEDRHNVGLRILV